MKSNIAAIVPAFVININEKNIYIYIYTSITENMIFYFVSANEFPTCDSVTQIPIFFLENVLNASFEGKLFFFLLRLKIVFHKKKKEKSFSILSSE